MNDENLIFRLCASCNNVLNLNLYPLNSEICRFCKENTEVPEYLIKKPINQEPINNLEEEVDYDSDLIE